MVVTREIVENPDEELERLLCEPSSPEVTAKFETLLSKEKMALKESIRAREDEFKKRYAIVFPEKRIDLIATRMMEKGYDLNTVFEEAVEVQRHVEEFEKEFERKHGVRLRFSQEAIDRVTEIAMEEDGKGMEVCARLSKDYEHGLKLISERTGKTDFMITREAVDNPQVYLNRMIREIYSKQSDQKTEGKE